ncbi:HNH endonuclease [Paracraurococcus lichenis]|uniref:Putative HNH nuclease YajD n=1 Tax=Paracraurococcus lichenis TaxID=3064888 RepID=A0ABT9E736_9PROT|nr:HNH endonuclease signature motif containing protein [Paracraurococcus sp. LOR1-02]MDO9711988.1 HNH endonuclease signature motif containing protein [Paracraurococcus sp. LOR1-02]
MPKTPPKHAAPTLGRDAIHVQEANRTRQRTYDRQWQKLRAAHLALHPLCEHCLLEGKLIEANEVDHIEPVKAAPHRRLDPTNLQSLCKPCHSRKTAAENAGRYV